MVNWKCSQLSTTFYIFALIIIQLMCKYVVVETSSITSGYFPRQLLPVVPRQISCCYHSRSGLELEYRRRERRPLIFWCRSLSEYRILKLCPISYGPHAKNIKFLVWLRRGALIVFFTTWLLVAFFPRCGFLYLSSTTYYYYYLQIKHKLKSYNVNEMKDEQAIMCGSPMASKVAM